ncbi:MAG: type II toxin-antitoxin system Phd/YefM family antitoxin [SAR324 cluster bacterium]|nr:type II toxin-antitoxin system Phd/YefM family antitoxin [SAR324 cluster bacterium]MBF0351131.1 type II toxin-antitoxin system Phd/YefM family antitoxin [SAR324 cluster bacterium]
MEYTVTEAKKYFNAIISAPDPVIILRKGKPESVVIPFETYRTLSQESLKLHEIQAVELAKKIHSDPNYPLLPDEDEGLE